MYVCMYVRKNNLTLYFTHLPSRHRRRICTKIGTASRLADVINCDNFFGNPLRGLDSVGGQSSLFPIDLADRR